MTPIKDLIRSTYPTMDEMLFCSALKEGRFNREELLKAEVVELYRAIKTRTTIQNIYKDKLRKAVKDGHITEDQLATMEEVIDDEGETDEHIDHIDMRYKLFVGTNINNKSMPKFHEKLEEVNKEWMAVCQDSDLFYLMAATAGIEDWYAPLAAFFEEQYGKRDFTLDEMELFTCHKEADVCHSEAQFDILEKNRDKLDDKKLVETCKRTFETSKAYDALKLDFARDNSKSLDDYFEN